MMNIAVPSFSDAPFHVAPDVVIDLPVPPSVNRTRSINWRSHKGMARWKETADFHVLEAKRRKVDPLRLRTFPRFELFVMLCEVKSRVDLDNGLKNLIDYLKRIELIQDDSPKHFRRLTVEFGHAPLGCRVTVRACA